MMGDLLVSVATEVIDARAGYNEEVANHGPESLEAERAKRDVLFAELVARELIDEN